MSSGPHGRRPVIKASTNENSWAARLRFVKEHLNWTEND